MNFLEIRNITHFYYERGVKIKALDNISLNIRRGSCIGIIGESGCGKSTLAKIITGLQTPSKGEIYYQEKILNKKNYKKYRSHIQMVFQNSTDALNPYKTIYESLSEPLNNINKKNFFSIFYKNERIKIIEKSLQAAKLSPQDRYKYPRQLSGGEKQRICIARALLSKPNILILDEPTSSLDVTVQNQILSLLEQVKKEKELTYILISHNLESIYRLSDTIIVMYKGQIIEKIEKIEKYFSMKHPYSKRLFNHDVRITSADFFLEIENEGCCYYNKCPEKNEICKNKKPLLKNINKNHYIACHFI